MVGDQSNCMNKWVWMQVLLPRTMKPMPTIKCEMYSGLTHETIMVALAYIVSHSSLYQYNYHILYFTLHSCGFELPKK